MSALTPHIRVLRAEAKALNAQAGECSKDAEESPADVQKGLFLNAGLVLGRMGLAKSVAADALEAEEREREAGVRS